MEVPENQSVGEEMEKAVTEYWNLAAAGDPEAQLCLGVCYRQGKGVEQDDAQAFYWVRCAAERGYASAQIYLAECYSEGCGTERDAVLAAEWIKRAAEQGCAEGQSLLGHCYLEGFGVEEDPEQAVPWLQKAAEQEDSDAYLALAACYFSGKGVEKDNAKGAMYCKRAAEAGCVKALSHLGFCYMHGKGVVKDLNTAEEYLRRAIETGDEQGWEEAEEQSKAHLLLAETCYARYVRDDLSLSALDIANCIPLIGIASWAVTFALGAGEKARLKEFLKTVEGRSMLEHLQIAADLGNEEAVSVLKKCRRAGF